MFRHRPVVSVRRLTLAVIVAILLSALPPVSRSSTPPPCSAPCGFLRRGRPRRHRDAEERRHRHHRHRRERRERQLPVPQRPHRHLHRARRAAGLLGRRSGERPGDGQRAAARRPDAARSATSARRVVVTGAAHAARDRVERSRAGHRQGADRQPAAERPRLRRPRAAQPRRAPVGDLRLARRVVQRQRPAQRASTASSSTAWTTTRTAPATRASRTRSCRCRPTRSRSSRSRPTTSAPSSAAPAAPSSTRRCAAAPTSSAARVWEFNRNDALNAVGFFKPSSGVKPKLNRNQFGFVFGGPIIRNRTFFFADYEGFRQISQGR